MAIAEMSRLTLVGLICDRDNILEAVQRTGAVQIIGAEEREMEQAAKANPSETELAAAISRAENALDVLTREIEAAPKSSGAPKPAVVKDGIGVTADEFFAVGKNLARYEKIIEDIERIASERAGNKSRENALIAERGNYEDYGCLSESFAAFRDTAAASVYLGIVPFEKTAALEGAIGAISTAWCRIEGAARRGNVAVAVCLSADKEETEKALAESGFAKCPFAEDITSAEKIKLIDAELDACAAQADDISQRACLLAPKSADVKIYIDYLSFLKEKLLAEQSFVNTESAFVLSAYVPTEATQRVYEAINDASRAVYADFRPVARSEFAPTLMKNKKPIDNFEAVTNMYSAPAYGALDPNGVMGFFFSLFMGLIMADVGYGIMMIAGGFWFSKKQREGTTVYRMARVFAYGGFFAIAFGLLLDSWLGLSLLRGLSGSYASILPAGALERYSAFYAQYIDPIVADSSIMGINIPSMLLWCLGLGTLHIAVSLILKAVQSFSRREIADGIFGGLVWAIMLLSFIVWVFCLAAGFNETGVYAMYVTAGFAAVGVLTAGISEKGFGKVTKVFTSAYGLINYASDILSYARLYGLMLSGAQIASIFTNTLAIQMLFPAGVAGVVFGVLVIIVGNVFNVAMSLLGAFIHDSRLQYVEFFGRFYEGEGELFRPFGRVYEHIYFK